MIRSLIAALDEPSSLAAIAREVAHLMGAESAALWLNRFSPPPSAYPITLQTISIYWPTQLAGDSFLIGKTASLFVYQDVCVS